MRPPDRIINGDYLHRWYVIPHNKWFNIYLHRFTASDDDRALHDHPWWSLSFCLKGKLREVLEDPHPVYAAIPDFEKVRQRNIRRFLPYLRSPTLMHRIILKSPVAWTLFLTGPKQRDWGFRTPNGGWISHSEWNKRHTAPIKYWTYSDPDENGNELITVMSEEEILNSYFSYWVGRMTAVGKQDQISKAECLDDWIVVNWAVECDSTGKLL